MSTIEKLYQAYVCGFRDQAVPPTSLEELTAAALGKRDSLSNGIEGVLLRNVPSVASAVRQLLATPAPQVPPAPETLPTTPANRHARRAAKKR